MERFVTDERTGLKYELVGDYYLIAGEDEPEQEQEPIGIWGQQHLRYLKEHHRVRYANLLTSGELNAYLADIDRHLRNAESQQPNGMGQANEFLPEPCIRNCLSPSNLYIRQGPSYRENDTEGLFLLIVLSKIRIQRRWGKETASRPAQS